MSPLDPQYQQFFDALLERLVEEIAPIRQALPSLTNQQMVGASGKSIRTVYRSARDRRPIRIDGRTYRSDYEKKGDRAVWTFEERER